MAFCLRSVPSGLGCCGQAVFSTSVSSNFPLSPEVTRFLLCSSGNGPHHFPTLSWSLRHSRGRVGVYSAGLPPAYLPISYVSERQLPHGSGREGPTVALQVKCLPGVREGAPGLSKEGSCPVSSPGHLNDSVPPEEVPLTFQLDCCGPSFFSL